VYGTAEWQGAWADDPQGLRRKLITVRVREDRLPGLLAGVVSIDLVGLSEAEARWRLLNEITAAVQGRAKPGSPPTFPLTRRAASAEPRFSGTLTILSTVPGRNPEFNQLSTVEPHQLRKTVDFLREAADERTYARIMFGPTAQQPSARKIADLFETCWMEIPVQ
jgi:hypothetical protein